MAHMLVKGVLWVAVVAAAVSARVHSHSQAEEKLMDYVRHVAWTESVVGSTIGPYEVLEYIPKHVHRALYHDVRAALRQYALHKPAGGDAHTAAAAEAPELLQLTQQWGDSSYPKLYSFLKGTDHWSRIKGRDAIGSGAYGTVFKVTEKETKTVRALKLVGYTKDLAPGKWFAGVDEAAKKVIAGKPEVLDSLRKEVETFAMLHAHQPAHHVVEYIGVVVAPTVDSWTPRKFMVMTPMEATKEDPRQLRGVVMEFCQMGDLHDFFGLSEPHGTGALIDFDTRAGFIQDALRGLVELHSAGFVHRDIKSENILLCLISDPKGQQRYVAKIGDLGLVEQSVATHAPTVEESFTKGLFYFAGTPALATPEVADIGRAKGLLDVFPMGIVIVRLLDTHDLVQAEALLDRGETFEINIVNTVAEAKVNVNANLHKCTTVGPQPAELTLPGAPKEKRDAIRAFLARAMQCSSTLDGDTARYTSVEALRAFDELVASKASASPSVVSTPSLPSSSSPKHSDVDSAARTTTVKVRRPSQGRMSSRIKP